MKKLFLMLLMMSTFMAVHASDKPSFKVVVKGKGQPLLLIPGLGCSGEVWESTVAALEKQYQCHVLTLPGFAGQPAVTFDKSYLEQVKQEIFAYVVDHDLQEVGLIGHSLGGFLSLQLAAEQPERFGPVLIVDALPFLPAIQMPAITEEGARATAENMRQMMLAQPTEGAEDRQRAVLASMVNDSAKLERILGWNMASDRKTMAQAMYDLYSTDLRDKIARIQKPVLVLGAWIAYKNYGVTKESSLQAYKSQYAKVPEVEVLLSDKGKHFIMYDDLELYFSGLQQLFPH